MLLKPQQNLKISPQKDECVCQVFYYLREFLDIVGMVLIIPFHFPGPIFLSFLNTPRYFYESDTPLGICETISYFT